MLSSLITFIHVDPSGASVANLTTNGLAKLFWAERGPRRSRMKTNRKEIIKLKECLKQIEYFTNKNNSLAFSELDAEFHKIILNICGNKWIIQIRDNLGSFIYRSRIKSLSVPGRLKRSLEEHRKIMESLKKHNSAEADRLSQIHMENTVINILKNGGL